MLAIAAWNVSQHRYVLAVVLVSVPVLALLWRTARHRSRAQKGRNVIAESQHSPHHGGGAHRTPVGDELRTLLLDDRCPWWPSLSTDGTRIIGTSTLLDYVRDREPTTLGSEEQLDAAVAALGGRRSRLIDPWGAAWNVVRLRRPGAGAGQELYAIPKARLVQ